MGGGSVELPEFSFGTLGEVWDVFPKPTHVTFVPFHVVYLYIYLFIPGCIPEKRLRQRYFSFDVRF